MRTKPKPWNLGDVHEYGEQMWNELRVKAEKPGARRSDVPASMAQDPAELLRLATSLLRHLPTVPDAAQPEALAQFFGRDQAWRCIFHSTLHAFSKALDDQSLGTLKADLVLTAWGRAQSDYIQERDKAVGSPTHHVPEPGNDPDPDAPLDEVTPLVFDKSWAQAAKTHKRNAANANQRRSAANFQILSTGMPTRRAIEAIGGAWKPATTQQLATARQILLDRCTIRIVALMRGLAGKCRQPQLQSGAPPDDFVSRILKSLPADGSWILGAQLLLKAGYNPGGGRYGQYLAFMSKPGGAIESRRGLGYRRRPSVGA